MQPATIENTQPAPGVEEYLIQTDDLTKRFGEQIVVNRVNLKIPPGLIFGFIGPSGCGKTTTIRLLTGYYRPSEGEVTVLGVNPIKFTRRQREQIGYMPQDFVLYKDLSVWENMNFAASMYGLGLRRRDLMNELLEFVELEHHKRKIVRKISGGMQRRLALAATLIHDPRLIFMDEPTGGIDPILRAKFWDYFDSLKVQGKSLFVTTQYISEAAYCDLVGVMNAGSLLVVDTPNGLRRRANGGDILAIRTPVRIDHQMSVELGNLPFVAEKVRRIDENQVHVIVDDAQAGMPELNQWFRQRHHKIESIQEYQTPLDEVFVRLIERNSDHETIV